MASSLQKIAERYGPIGLLTFDRTWQQLQERGMSETRAMERAMDLLRCCSKCGNPVSLKKKPQNKRSRDDGWIDHIDCSPREC